LIGKQPGLRMPPAGPLPAEQIEIVKSWIEQGADWPDDLSGEISTAPADPSFARMMSALRRADRQEFRKILREDPQAANRKGPGGAAPIIYAAAYGDVESVRLLLEKGVDPNARSGEGRTALLVAA